jgi:hypothetical protein
MSVLGKYTSLTTPPVKVNHTGQGEYADPTAALFPLVQRGSGELPDGAGFCLSKMDMSFPIVAFWHAF